MKSKAQEHSEISPRFKVGDTVRFRPWRDLRSMGYDVIFRSSVESLEGKDRLILKVFAPEDREPEYMVVGSNLCWVESVLDKPKTKPKAKK